MQIAYTLLLLLSLCFPSCIVSLVGSSCAIGVHYAVLGFSSSHRLVYCYPAPLDDFDVLTDGTQFPPVEYFVIDVDNSSNKLTADVAQDARNIKQKPGTTLDLSIWIPFQGGGYYFGTMFQAANQILTSGSTLPSLSSLGVSSPSYSSNMTQFLGSRLLINVVGWTFIASDPLVCTSAALAALTPNQFGSIDVTNGTEKTYLESRLLCPDVLILGTTQIANRWSQGVISPMTQLLQAWQIRSQSALQDDFLRFYFYDLFLDNEWQGLPLVSDLRIVYYNRTTFTRLNLTDPPPLSITNPDLYERRNKQDWPLPFATSWSWDTFVSYAHLLEKDATEHGYPGYGFTFYGCYNEELKMLSAFANNYRTQLVKVNAVVQNVTVTVNGVAQPSTQVRQQNVCGFRGSTTFEQAYDRVFNKMFNVDTSMSHTFAILNQQNPQFKQWLNTPVNQSGPLLQNPIPTVSCCSCWDMSFFWGMAWESSSALSIEHMADNNIGIALSPGATTFLGGSVIALTGMSPSLIDFAASYIAMLVDSSLPYLHGLGVAANSIPPYESAFNVAPWNSPAYALFRQQSSNAKPSEYPSSTFPQFNALEANFPMRMFMVETLYKQVPTSIALNRACDAIDTIVAPPCSSVDYSIVPVPASSSSTTSSSFLSSSSSPAACGGFFYVWNEPKICIGGASLPVSTIKYCATTPTITRYELTSSMAQVLTSMTVVCVVLLMVCALFVYQNRTTRLVYRASLPLLSSLIFGGLCACVFVFLRSTNMSSGTCALLPYLSVCAVTFPLSVLIVHLSLLHHIFNSHSLLVVTLSHTQFRLRVLLLFLPSMIIVFIWQGVEGGLQATTVYTGEVDTVTVLPSSSSSSSPPSSSFSSPTAPITVNNLVTAVDCTSSVLVDYWSILFGYNLFLVALATYSLLRVRVYPDSFTQAQINTLLLVHHTCLLFVVHAVYLFVNMSNQTWRVFVSAVVIELVCATISIVFAPKMYKIYGGGGITKKSSMKTRLSAKTMQLTQEVDHEQDNKQYGPGGRGGVDHDNDDGPLAAIIQRINKMHLLYAKNTHTPPPTTAGRRFHAVSPSPPAAAAAVIASPASPPPLHSPLNPFRLLAPLSPDFYTSASSSSSSSSSPSVINVDVPSSTAAITTTTTTITSNNVVASLEHERRNLLTQQADALPALRAAALNVRKLMHAFDQREQQIVTVAEEIVYRRAILQQQQQLQENDDSQTKKKKEAKQEEANSGADMGMIVRVQAANNNEEENKNNEDIVHDS